MYISFEEQLLKVLSMEKEICKGNCIECTISYIDDDGKKIIIRDRCLSFPKRTKEEKKTFVNNINKSLENSKPLLNEQVTILLSIHPKHAKNIFNGSKKREYRKFKNKMIQEIYLYITSPIKKIAGRIIVDQIIHDKIENLWDLMESGITKKEFLKYYENKEQGTMIIFKEVNEFTYPIEPDYIFYKRKFKAPQSYMYLKQEEIRLLKEWENKCNKLEIE